MSAQSIVTSYFENILTLLSAGINSNKSIYIISEKVKVFSIINGYFNNIFSDIPTVSKEIEYIHLNHIDKDSDIEKVLIQEISLIFGKVIQNLSNLNNFLQINNKKLYVSLENEEEAIKQKIYSFKYILGNRLNFIFYNTNDVFVTDEFFKIFVPQFVIKEILELRLNELQISLKEEEKEKLIFHISLNIMEIDSIIIKYLYSKIPNGLDQSLQNNPVKPPMPLNDTLIPAEESSIENAVLNSARPELKHIEVKPNIEIKNENTNLSKAVATVNQQNKVKLEDVNVKLTPRENEIYQNLKEKKSITRDELSSIVWGEEASIKGNPDAIDQIISRLRKKFVKAGYDKSFITSVKGEGIFLNA